MPETWPNIFPNPESGFGISNDSPVDVIRFESMEYRQRPVRRGQRRKLSVNWVFKGVRLAMLIAWIHYKLDKGKDFFNIDLPVDGGGFTTVSARLVGPVPKIQVTLAELPYTWRVQAELETFD